jgi:hypothetical protein
VMVYIKKQICYVVVIKFSPLFSLYSGISTIYQTHLMMTNIKKNYRTYKVNFLNQIEFFLQARVRQLA